MILQAKENLEDLIVKTLAQAGILSASDMLVKISKMKRTFSIQAIYKELRKLQKGGVVLKLKQSYALRLPWIVEFTSLAKTMSESCTSVVSINKILSDSRKHTWHFDNLLKLNDFWSHILLALVKRSKNKILFGWNPYTWFHLAQIEQEEQYMRSLKIAGAKLYLIIGDDSYLNHWAEKFLDKKIVTYSFGKSTFHKDKSFYLNLVDDYILTVKLGEKTNKAIEDLYARTKSWTDIDIPAISNLFGRKIKGSICLEKNPTKGKVIRGRFVRFFGFNMQTNKELV